MQRRCAAELHHRQQHAALAILLDDVHLRLEAIAHMRDFAQIGDGPIHTAHRQLIHRVDSVGRSIHTHGMFQLAELGGAGGQDQVLRGDRGYHISRCQALGQQCLRIQVNGYHARLAAIRERHGRARHGDQLRAHLSHADVVQLLL